MRMIKFHFIVSLAKAYAVMITFNAPVSAARLNTS